MVSFAKSLGGVICFHVCPPVDLPTFQISAIIALITCCCYFSVIKSCSTLCSPVNCPSLSPGICSNSYSLSQWCHPTISFSVSFSSCPQYFPVSGSFPLSWLFASDGQSIRASASASVLPMNIQGWFSIGFSALLKMFVFGVHVPMFAIKGEIIT